MMREGPSIHADKTDFGRSIMVEELDLIDPYDIGWWIESADEEIYGPVSRKTLRRFLQDGVISPNTLVRHCTQTEAGPVGDQPGMTEGLQVEGRPRISRDRVAEVWPRDKRARLALANDE